MAHGLTAVPAQPAAVPGAGTAPSGTGSVPDAGTGDGRTVLMASTVKMTAAERARAAARKKRAGLAAIAREIWAPFARLGRRLLNPMTPAEHRAHVMSRAGIPPDLEGRAHQIVTCAWVGYHLAFARPAKATLRGLRSALMAGFRSVESCVDYPLAFFGLLAFAFALYLILTH